MWPIPLPAPKGMGFLRETYLRELYSQDVRLTAVPGTRLPKAGAAGEIALADTTVNCMALERVFLDRLFQLSDAL